MEFKAMLQKLKYSNGFNCSLLNNDIIANIRYVDKTELLDILELLHGTADMEYQVKLLSIMTAYLLFNNSNRDVIIKSTNLYDKLRTILIRGLPLKSTITLNFITSLLYAEDDGSSRSRTLILHAQNLIRNSGCLAAIARLFTNCMLHTETWQALCRCLAEVCRGSELNQNFCSHLVPLCIQRCLQGNPDSLPVLQSLLFNHKRNTNLFLETDGALMFKRKDYLRLEACLQLLHTVIQSAEVDALSTLSVTSGVHENLQNLIKMDSVSRNIAQWTTVVLYYLDLKLKGSDKRCNPKKTYLKQSTAQMDSNANDTEILLQNIMREILSYPSKRHADIPLIRLTKTPDEMGNICDISCITKETELHNQSNLEKRIAPTVNSTESRERLPFSFLMDKSLRFEQSYLNVRDSNNQNRETNQTVDNNKFIQNEDSRELSKLGGTSNTISGKCANLTGFNPTFVSTPKRLASKMSSLSKTKPITRAFNELKNKSGIRYHRIIKKLPQKKVSNDKHHTQRRSMSSRLLDAINESCTTIIKSVKNVFTGNKSCNTSKAVTTNISPVEREEHKTYCSYSFTNYMNRRQAEREHSASTRDTVTVCNTCDDTYLLQQKCASNEELKSIVKKLKLGINLYGCDFKRISKTMWPRETYITPNILYNLYRKLLLK